jgi:hypothetical protein
MATAYATTNSNSIFNRLRLLNNAHIAAVLVVKADAHALTMQLMPLLLITACCVAAGLDAW